MRKHLIIWSIFLYCFELWEQRNNRPRWNEEHWEKKVHVSINWGAGKTITAAAWSVYINPADAKHFPMLCG